MSRNKQSILLEYALQHENKIKTKEANELLARFYYCNHAFYVSQILTRMVKNGTFIREKIGHYKIASQIHANQLTLF